MPFLLCIIFLVSNRVWFLLVWFYILYLYCSRGGRRISVVTFVFNTMAYFYIAYIVFYSANFKVGFGFRFGIKRITQGNNEESLYL